MRRPAIIATTSLTFLLAATACGSAESSGTTPPPPRLVEARNVTQAQVPKTLDTRPLAQSVASLGYHLAPELATQAKNGNLVFSPVSLEIALAMLREGARGHTATLMDKVLQLPSDRSRQFDALIRALARDTSDGNTLSIGDGVFVDPSLPVRPSYLTALKTWYDTGVFETAFPDPALDQINAFVDEKTHGRIPHLLSEMPPGTLLDLVNTVYLKAAWATPFIHGVTTDAPFTTGSGDKVQVKMMSQATSLEYADGSGWQAVRLPYRGDRLSMIVLVPSGDTAPLDLLSPRVLAGASQSFSATYLQLDLPRWNIGNRFDLMDPLTALGLGDLMESPDLSGMVEGGPGLNVAQASQQANITVGEKGTVAAAVTTILMAGGAEPIPVVSADHPFAYAIVDNATGAPLFEGTVSDPTAS
jgi:serpin B